jgi:polo-like kinase 1
MERKIYIETCVNNDGTSFNREWIEGEYISKGSTSRVYKFTMSDKSSSDEENTQEVHVSKSETIYAGKVILGFRKLSLKKQQMIRDEIRIHRRLDHKNIVKFVTYFQHEDSMIIIMKYCENEGMDYLLNVRKRLSEDEVRYYMIRVLDAIQYMHGNNIIHRDIKPGNIFLDNELNVNIGDFGFSAQLSYDGERLTRVCGTPNYVAPEVLEPGEVGYSYEADIWSIGVIIYLFICGIAPFETRNVGSTAKNILKVDYSFPEYVEISEHAKDLINSILQKDPAKRPSIKEIKEHNFFKAHNIPESLSITSLTTPPTDNDISYTN